MAKGDLKRTLMDVRKMRRAVRMRKETDPEVVSQTLETILQEAIAISTTEDKVMSRAAIKEIQQVRKGLVAQQIDAGTDSTKYIGAFSAVLDTIDQTAAEVQQQAAAEREEFRSGMMESLPSSDTMISAIMTANPILGYSMKIGRDLMSSAKKSSEARRKRDKEEAALRKQRLEEQKFVVEEQLETEEMKRDHLEGKSPAGEIYEKMLSEIRDEIHQLNVVLSDQSDSLEKIHEQEVISTRLEREAQSSEGLRASESLLEQEDGSSGTLSLDQKALDKEGDGFFSNILGMITGGAASIFGPLVKFLGVFKTAGKLFLRLGKVSGIIGAVMAVYDFVDGFMNAGDILDQENVDWKDRIKVGFSSILSGLLEPINWISETFFGKDLMGGKSRDEMTKQYFDFFDNFGENILGMAKWIGDSIVSAFTKWKDKAVEWIGDLGSKAFAPLQDLWDSITNFISDGIKDMVPDWAKGMLGIEEEEQSGQGKKVTDSDFIDNVSDTVSKGIDKAEEIVPNWMKGWFGGEEDSKVKQIEEDTISSPNATTRATTASENQVAQQTMSDMGRALNVNAPNSSQTNINNHQYQGSGSSENREPTHRRFSSNNHILGTGNL